MSTSDDFYVYLKSNSNKKEFTSNKHNSFTNVVKPLLQLNDEYEVALQNIIFNPDITAIKSYDPFYKICITVQFINSNNRVGNVYDVDYIPTQNIYGSTIEEILDGLNQNLMKYLKHKMLFFLLKVIFSNIIVKMKLSISKIYKLFKLQVLQQMLNG